MSRRQPRAPLSSNLSNSTESKAHNCHSPTKHCSRLQHSAHPHWQQEILNLRLFKFCIGSWLEAGSGMSTQLPVNFLAKGSLCCGPTFAKSWGPGLQLSLMRSPVHQSISHSGASCIVWNNTEPSRQKQTLVMSVVRHERLGRSCVQWQGIQSSDKLGNRGTSWSAKGVLDVDVRIGGVPWERRRSRVAGNKRKTRGQGPPWPWKDQETIEKKKAKS